jgi:uncharacterized protein YjiS (DUF1127 family)
MSATTIISAGAGGETGLVDRMASLAKSCLSAYRDWRQCRRDMAELRSMPDRGLHDLGIERGSIDGGRRQHPWRHIDVI